MRSSAEAPALDALRRDARRAALIAFGVALQLVEQGLPGLGPWFKPGLANLAALLALALGGAKEAAIVAGGRILLGAWFSGGWLAPSFVISIAAGAASLAVMIALHRLRMFSLVGISLAGASAHITVQLIVVQALFAAGASLWPLLPWLLPPAMLAGWINGALAGYIAERLRWDDWC